QAAHLPDVMQDPKAGEMWWNLAKRFLLESYPALDPASKAKLTKIAPVLLNLSQVPNPKDRRKRIVYNIKRAFMKVLAESPKKKVADSNTEILERLKQLDPDLYKRI